MIPMWKVHKKFGYYWKEYQWNDVDQVCTALLRLMNKGFNNPIATVRNNWSSVCNYLIQWEGHT